MERDRICAAEVWCECLGGDLKYIKREELKIYIDNFNLSSEAVVKKAREFEDLANLVYEIKNKL